MRLRRRPKRRRKKRQGQVQQRPPRITEEALRRKWAQKDFTPSAGWLHLTDAGFVVYDMWEHMDSPPEGDRHGMRTRKVLALPTTLRQQHVLLNDYRAWVGLPVHFESAFLAEKRAKAARPNNLKLLMDVCPYGWRQFNLPPTKKEKEKEKSKNQADIDEPASDGEPVIDEDGRPIFSAEKVEKMLARFGYDPLEGKKKKIYRIGSISYDIQTGRKIVHSDRPNLDDLLKKYGDDSQFASIFAAAAAEGPQVPQDDLSSVGNVSVSSVASGPVSIASEQQRAFLAATGSSSLLLSDKHSLLGRSKLSVSISGMVSVTGTL